MAFYIKSPKHETSILIWVALLCNGLRQQREIASKRPRRHFCAGNARWFHDMTDIRRRRPSRLSQVQGALAQPTHEPFRVARPTRDSGRFEGCPDMGPLGTVKGMLDLI